MSPLTSREWARAFTTLERAGECWKIDRWTAEVVTALRNQGIPPVLLKGPAIARWLYAKETVRPYCDIDLMVSPSQLPEAEQVLRRIGFTEPLHAEWMRSHARTWVRPADGAKVDLHRTLHCLETTPQDEVWHAVTVGADTIEVGGVPVEVPGPVVRTLHVALHLGVTEDPKSKPSEDLRRAISQVDAQTWQAAADLARRLGVDDDMGQRLGQAAGGAELAHQLGLPTVGSLRSYLIADLEHEVVAAAVYQLWCLNSMPTVRAKVRWILQRQFPARRYMEEWYPAARKGVVGLAASYVLRALESCARLPSAVLAWHRVHNEFKRTAGRGQQPSRGE